MQYSPKSAYHFTALRAEQLFNKLFNSLTYNSIDKCLNIIILINLLLKNVAAWDFNTWEQAISKMYLGFSSNKTIWLHGMKINWSSTDFKYFCKYLVFF